MGDSLPKRPQLNQIVKFVPIGRRITLHTNLFPINVQEPDISVFDNTFLNASEDQSSMLCETQLRGYQEARKYSISFLPEVQDDNRKQKGKLLREAKNLINEQHGKFWESGNQLVIQKDFNNRSYSRKLDREFDEDIMIDAIVMNETMHSMKLNYNKTINLKGSGKEIQQITNSLMKKYFKEAGMTEIGKKKRFYHRFPVNLSLRNGQDTHKMELYKGVEACVQQINQQPYLKIDFISTLLRSESVLENISLLKQNFNMKNIQKNSRQPLEEYISLYLLNKSVIAKYGNNTKYRIIGVDFGKNPSYRMPNNGLTLNQYYKKSYDITIEDQSQPLLVSKFKYQNTQKLIYLIPELCHLTGIPSGSREDNKKAMQEISEETRMSSSDRYSLILKHVKRLKAQMSEEQISIENQSLKVDSLLLTPPKIYFQGGPMELVNGKFNFKSMRPNQQKKIASLEHFIVVCFRKDQNHARAIINYMKEACFSLNIFMGDPAFVFVDEKCKDVEQVLDRYLDSTGLPGCIISYCQKNRKSDRLYQEMKRFCYEQVNGGITHQHITSNSLVYNKYGTQLSIASNIVLQIVSKDKEVPWTLEKPCNLNNQTMLIGISHSDKSVLIQNKPKQVVGFVASLDADFRQFYSIQHFRDKKSFDFYSLTKHIEQALIRYMILRKTLPEEIVIFRYGASNEQIRAIQELEIKAIENGFYHVDRGYKPRLCYLTVLSKIGEKFFNQTKQAGPNQFSNPESGSVVVLDKASKNFEFYLCAQNCNSGVCIPTKYICAKNTTNLNPRDIQQLSYFQCFNYCNWQGSIKFPAPLMYAKKLAQFTSDHCNLEIDKRLSIKLYYV